MQNTLQHIYQFMDMKTEVNEVFLHRMIDVIAFSMIGVFIPIYLMNIGYGLNNAIIYMAFTYFFYALFSAPSLKLAQLIGIKKTIVLSQFLMILFMAWLYATTKPEYSVLYFALFIGLTKMLYWMPLNTEFAITSHKGKTGKETALLHALPNMVAILGPIVGGTIITLLGFDNLFTIASILFLLSVIPLFMTEERREPIKIRAVHFFKTQNRPVMNVFLAKGFFFGTFVLWPLYVYTLFPNYVFTGLATGAIGFTTAIFTILIGNAEDKRGSRLVLSMGGALNFLIWLFALFATSKFEILFISFFLGFSSSLILVPTYDYALKLAKKRKNAAEVMYLREVPLAIGRFMVLLLPVVIPYPYKFHSAFIIAAIISLYFYMTTDVNKIS